MYMDFHAPTEETANGTGFTVVLSCFKCKIKLVIWGMITKYEVALYSSSYRDVC